VGEPAFGPESRARGWLEGVGSLPARMTGRATEFRERALTGALGLCLVPAALWGALASALLVTIAAQPPDELEPDGDPCCAVPDAWGDVARFSAIALFASGLDLAALTLGCAFLWFAVLYRWPDRRIVRVPVIATGGVAVLLAAVLVARAT
jgi:hypothetical protein